MLFHMDLDILSNLYDAIIVVNLGMQIIFWGPGAERIYGFTAAEICNCPISDIIPRHINDPAKIQALYQAMEDDRVWRGEICSMHQRGDLMDVMASVNALTNARGERESILLVVRDMTDHRRIEASLRVSEDRFRAIQEVSLDGTTIVRTLRDADGTIIDFTCTYLNPVAERLVGQSLALAQGRRMTEVFPGVVESGLLARYCAVATSGKPQIFEQHYTADGINAWYRNMVVPLGDGLAIIFSDITAQKQNEAQIAFQASMLNAVRQPVIATDLTGVIYYWNQGAEDLYGWTSAEACGRNAIGMLVAEPDQAQARAIVMGMHQNNTGEIREYLVHHRDGTPLSVLFNSSSILDTEGTLIGFVGVATDITQRKRMEQELQESRDTLEQRVEVRTYQLKQANVALQAEIAERTWSEQAREQLIQKIVTAQEEERRHIARELHDQISQDLTALLLGFKILQGDSDIDERIVADIAQLQGMAAQISDEVRHLAVQLRPSVLDEVGLAQALIFYVEQWSAWTDTAVDFHLSGLEGTRLPLVVETTLYRIVQEALSNVRKHAQASEVSVIIGRRANEVRLIVEDDGVGFAMPISPESTESTTRMGLISMRERAELLGGSLTIETAPGSGTTIFANIPLSITKG